MTKEQFNNLLHSPSTINLNMVKGLEEITQQFPYFRNAHLLLAKQYQGHENIRYEGYLRKAAAYAADRRMLYDLIKLEPATIIHMHRDEPEMEWKQQPETSTLSQSEIQEQKADTFQPSLQEILQAEMHVEDKFDYELSEQVTEQTNPVNSVEPEEIVDNSIPEITEVEETEESTIHQPDSEINTFPIANAEQESTIQEDEESEIAIENSNVIEEQPETEYVHSEKEEQPETEYVHSEKEEQPETEYVHSEKEEQPETEYVHSEKEEQPETEYVHSEKEEQPETENVVSEKIELVPESQTETKTEEEITAFESNSELSDPKEIIEKRLREIANSSNQESEISEPVVEINEETKPLIEPVATVKNTIAEISEPEKAIEISEEKIAPPKEEIKKPVEHHTFLDWLKLKDIPVLPVDRNRDYFGKMEPRHLDADGNPIDPEDELIDNFIKTEPRIVPAKSEFYSPGNMARQSAMEHEDLISETLARIYAQQGNIPKAIDAYRRLSLKMPEKSSYFAALIRELEENNPS